jgi:hypothetical protein
VRGDTLPGKNGGEDEADLLRRLCMLMAAEAQARGRITASRVQPSAQPKTLRRRLSCASEAIELCRAGSDNLRRSDTESG